MSGLEKIIDRIHTKAEEKRESILKEARKEAKEKKSEAQERAEEEKQRIIAKGEKEAKQIKRRELANTRKSARENKLEAREEKIQEVFKKSREELGELKEDEEKYGRVLKSLIISGGTAMDGGELSILISESDEKLLEDSDIREAEEKIAEETGRETDLDILPRLEDGKEGAIVQKKDGSISSNNTFEARLKRMKSSLRSEIADILFEE